MSTRTVGATLIAGAVFALGVTGTALAATPGVSHPTTATAAAARCAKAPDRLARLSVRLHQVEQRTEALKAKDAAAIASHHDARAKQIEQHINRLAAADTRVANRMKTLEQRCGLAAPPAAAAAG